MREINENLSSSYYGRMGVCADILVKLVARDLKSIYSIICTLS